MDAVSLMSQLFVVCDMHVYVCGVWMCCVLCVTCMCVCVVVWMCYVCGMHVCVCVCVWLYGYGVCVCVVVWMCCVVCAACMCVRVYGCVVFSGTIKHLMKDVADPITTREGKSIFPVMKKLIQSTIPESELYIPNSKGGGEGGRRRVCLPLGFWLKFHRSP